LAPDPSDTKEPVNLRAFGVASDQILLAHDLTALAEVTYPIGKRSGRNLPLQRPRVTWSNSGPLDVPEPYTFLAGDGNHIVSCPDARSLPPSTRRTIGWKDSARWLAQVFFRSRDGGASWGDITMLRDTAAEVGLLPLGGQRVLAACAACRIQCRR